VLESDKKRAGQEKDKTLGRKKSFDTSDFNFMFVVSFPF
jgi:hypothetical protein